MRGTRGRKNRREGEGAGSKSSREGGIRGKEKKIEWGDQKARRCNGRRDEVIHD